MHVFLQTFDLLASAPISKNTWWFLHQQISPTFRWLPPAVEALHSGIESTWSGTGLRGTPRKAKHWRSYWGWNVGIYPVYLENFHGAILDDFRIWFFVCKWNGFRVRFENINFDFPNGPNIPYAFRGSIWPVVAFAGDANYLLVYGDHGGFKLFF